MSSQRDGSGPKAARVSQMWLLSMVIRSIAVGLWVGVDVHHVTVINTVIGVFLFAWVLYGLVEFDRVAR